MEVPCVLNIAAVKLKSKDYDQAIYECNKVLDIEVRLFYLLSAFSFILIVFPAGAGLRPRLGDQGPLQTRSGSERQAELRARPEGPPGGAETPAGGQRGEKGNSYFEKVRPGLQRQGEENVRENVWLGGRHLLLESKQFSFYNMKK